MLSKADRPVPGSASRSNRCSRRPSEHPGGVLLAQHVDQAMVEWRQARAELADSGQMPAAERLFHLTRLPCDHLASMRDEMRFRALLETALELLTSPRHRQVLRGTLACSAARVGDLAAADAWLSGCNPKSDDIHVDTAWRFAAAYVRTVRKDWKGVLQALGSRLGDVPLAEGEVEACALLRANAIEQLGQGLAIAVSTRPTRHALCAASWLTIRVRP